MITRIIRTSVRHKLLVRMMLVGLVAWGSYSALHLPLDAIRLSALGVSLAEMYGALEAGNGNSGGSYLERGRNAYFIRGEGRAGSLQDVGSIVIKQTGAGLPLLVRDVADVRFGHAVRYGAITRNGEGETVGGIVLMLKGASSESTIAGVKARVTEIDKQLPAGLFVRPFLDRTKLVDTAIQTVALTLFDTGADITRLVRHGAYFLDAELKKGQEQEWLVVSG